MKEPGPSAATSGETRHAAGACPLDCPDTCSWIVTVKSGEAIALRGNPAHPFTRGALCNKVADYLDYTSAAARVLHPLRRVGSKGSGAFTRITWDEALDTIAARLREAIATHGGESIWPYLGSGNMGVLQGAYSAGQRFWNVLGASRHVQNICTIAGGYGTGYTLGDNRVGMDPDTFRYSKLIVLWGANVLSTHPHLWRAILEARKSGAYVVTIDPIRTRTAAQSDGHLAPIPGSDAALALALLHVVLDERQEDPDFIRDHTLGWEAFRARVAEFPPSRAAELTGLDVGAIIELGKRLAHSRPTGIRIGIGIQRHGGGMAVLIAYGHLYLAWNEPAVSPPGGCLPATELFRRLAQTMQLEEPALNDSDDTLARQVLDSAHPSLAGITLEALKARGWMRLNYPDPFVPFAEGFPDPSGRLQFVSARMAQDGLDPVAGYTPAYEAGHEGTGISKTFPLMLITPANHYFLNSIFANVPRQRRRAGVPALLIHSDDARVRHIASGDEVRIGNARGSFTAIAEVSDRIRPGTVASTKGYWPQHAKHGATVNATVDARDADMGHGAVYHDNRVQVTK